MPEALTPLFGGGNSARAAHQCQYLSIFSHKLGSGLNSGWGLLCVRGSFHVDFHTMKSTLSKYIDYLLVSLFLILSL